MSDDLTDAAGPMIEANPKWIRGSIGDLTVVDSHHTLFVWEHRYYPQWYIPIDDVAGELRPTGETRPTDDRGLGVVNDLVVARAEGADSSEIVRPSAAMTYPNAPVEELRRRVRFSWDALDRWHEEEVEVFVHPRSPHTRIDALPSSRRVEVHIDGVQVAGSNRPTILYETGLAARYYLPKQDVRMELLIATDSTTACPYKGVARYWSVTVDGTEHTDVVWGYDDPLPESAGVKGLVCFYDERVDLTVDQPAAAAPVLPSTAEVRQ